VFEKYGADALRLWYYSDALPGSNAPLREEKIRETGILLTRFEC
jgi:valyl-tRNA synthetase